MSINFEKAAKIINDKDNQPFVDNVLNPYLKNHPIHDDELLAEKIISLYEEYQEKQPKEGVFAYIDPNGAFAKALQKKQEKSDHNDAFDLGKTIHQFQKKISDSFQQNKPKNENVVDSEDNQKVNETIAKILLKLFNNVSANDILKSLNKDAHYEDLIKNLLREKMKDKDFLVFALETMLTIGLINKGKVMLALATLAGGTYIYQYFMNQEKAVSNDDNIMDAEIIEESTTKSGGMATLTQEEAEQFGFQKAGTYYLNPEQWKQYESNKKTH